MFLTDEDAIILMSYNPTMKFHGYPIREHILDDRMRLYDAGIRTANEFIMWDAVEPQRGQYNWSSVERILELNRAAGLKTMFSVCQYSFPNWMPGEWFACFKGGYPYRQIMSWWNPESNQYVLDYYSKLETWFGAPDVQFILSEFLTGESILWNEPSWFDPWAIKSFQRFVGVNNASPSSDATTGETREWLINSVKKWYIDRQLILGKRHREVYDSHQLLIADQSPANMNWAMPQVLDWFHESYGSMFQMMMIQYTYFAHLKHPEGTGRYRDYIEGIVERNGTKIIVEAQYCQGLENTTPIAISHNRFGQIVCPLHPFLSYNTLEQWMVDAIAKANKLWMESRKEKAV